MRTLHCYQTLADLLTERNLKRQEEVVRIFSRGDVALGSKRADRMRAMLRQRLQLNFPAAPQNPRMTGREACNGYRLERWLLQSMPGYEIPVHLYLPERMAAPAPPFLVSVGHDMAGKAVADNQIMCANLAMQGYVVAISDPPCQGERSWLPQEKRRELFAQMPEDIVTVCMHMLPGNLSYLLGEDLGAYFVWDGMRVIDFLLDREEVDPSLLGITGRSGGGTLTAYLAALDERVRYYSPVQCLSRLAMSVTRNGIGDCEQSILGMADPDGFDYADLLWAAWPKPLMANAGLRDFFFIEGLRELESEIRQLYQLCGDEDDFCVMTADCGHENTPETRNNTYRWFGSIYGREAPSEREVALRTPEEMACLTQRSGRTILDVLEERLAHYKALRPKDAASFAEGLRKLLPVTQESCRIEWLDKTGSWERFLLHTNNSRSIYCCWKDGQGDLCAVVKGNNALTEEPTVAIPNPLLILRPWGIASANKQTCGYDEETMLFNLAAVLGENLFAQRITQILCAIQYGLERTGAENALLAGDGAGGILALFSAWFESKIVRCALVDCITSYDSLFGQESYVLPETSILPGFSRLGDLGDVVRTASAQVEMIAPLGPDGRQTVPPDDRWQQVKRFWEV